MVLNNDDFLVLLKAVIDKSSLTQAQKDVAKQHFDASLDLNIDLQEFAKQKKLAADAAGKMAGEIQQAFNKIGIKIDNGQALAVTREYFDLVKKVGKEEEKANRREAKNQATKKAREQKKSYDDVYASLEKLYKLKKEYAELDDKSSRKGTLLSDRIKDEENLLASRKSGTTTPDNWDPEKQNAITQREIELQKELEKVYEEIAATQQKIANNVSNLSYDRQFSNLEATFRGLGLESAEIADKTKDVSFALSKLKSDAESGSFEKLAADEEMFTQALRKAQNEAGILKNDLDSIYNPRRQNRLSVDLQNWLSKNTRASKDARESIQAYLNELNNGKVSNARLESIQMDLKQIDAQQRGLKRLGKSLKDQFSQAATDFSQWLTISSAIMFAVDKTKEAFSELVEVDTYLTEISKANNELSKSQLAQIGNDAFDVASAYGKKATNYLAGVQEMSRAGYKNNADAMAELSVAAQGAGDMTAELANQFIVATDKAYNFQGSVESIATVLDGVNNITNNNAVNMSELSEGLSIVGSTAASFGIEANELTAVLGTMAARTQQSGSEVARAFRAILLNIRQVSDEEEGIDAEGLTKYEEACNALGVSLKETVNGVLQTRDAMEVLEDLSKAYVKLGENDVKRTQLLNSVGGKLRATQLDALLRGWSDYEAMLQQYEDGMGSMAREAEKTAQSWQGSLNRLSNTWADTVQNIANSDMIIGAINSLNGMFDAINKTTDAIGSVGSIGLMGVTAGIGAFIKNFGKPIRVTIKFSYVFNWPLVDKKIA